MVSTDPASNLDDRCIAGGVPLDEALRRTRAGVFPEGQTALSILLATPFLECDADGTREPRNLDGRLVQPLHVVTAGRS